MFFEGSEKKIEILLKPGTTPLRRHPDIDWHHVVSLARATVLSTVSNELCDAYLLSESSLFVFQHRVVMITCGTTSLVAAVEEMLRTFNRDDILFLMYERKNELSPEDQHSDYEEDARRLRRFVPGNTTIFGKENDHYVAVFHYGPDCQPQATDMTLEVLMHEIDREAAAPFMQADIGKPALYERTGVNRIFDEFAIDDFIFDPMGYSLNGICEREYYTFHITPQSECSYASFETNRVFGEGELEATLNKVLAIFRPRIVTAVYFDKNAAGIAVPTGYSARTASQQRFCGFDVLFANYRKA
ncbi:hypothetical protein [Acanthopleuribacter pedis]|uniref:Adenosylmethionine decarboxylase n=1 Tax=Acanthopleuribacter pedis TaxID=442870 RepID=A0A8J7Q7H4_9BACT|nr:hypothetical protein [Acanthopleuribacter pedis]MBO1319756.1 hypothetical protein [Acanthopleuribacter pedis]